MFGNCHNICHQKSLNTYFGMNPPRLTLKTYSTSLCSTWGSKSLESLTISLALNMQLNFIFICHKKRYKEITIFSIQKIEKKLRGNLKKTTGLANLGSPQEIYSKMTKTIHYHSEQGSILVFSLSHRLGKYAR